MECSVEQKHEVTIIKPVGRLDSHSTPEFEHMVGNHLESPESNLLLDCNDLDYISSIGLRVILQVAKKYNTLHYEFGACSMQDHVREVFEISGFDSFVPIYDSEAEFIKTVKPS